MNYRERLARALAPRRRPPPPPAAALREITQGLLRLQQILTPSPLPEDASAGPRRPVPPGTYRQCLAILRRRPALAAAAGLTADELAALWRTQLALEALVIEAEQLERATRLGRRRLAAALCEGHRQLRGALRERADSPQTPPGQALRLRAALGQRPAGARRSRGPA